VISLFSLGLLDETDLSEISWSTLLLFGGGILSEISWSTLLLFGGGITEAHHHGMRA